MLSANCRDKEHWQRSMSCLSTFGPKMIIFCWYLILVPPVRIFESGMMFSLTLIDRTNLEP